MKRLSSSSNGNYSCSKFGSYGTFIFPERKGKGFWRFQTDYPPLVEHMRLRDWNSKSPWKVTGWGTSWIFSRRFSGTYEAHRSVRSIFRKIGEQEIDFNRSEILKPCNNASGFESESKSDLKAVLAPKPPPMTRKKPKRGIDTQLRVSAKALLSQSGNYSSPPVKAKTAADDENNSGGEI